MSTNNINLGELPVCSEAIGLPFNATATGTWAFMTTFNGAYQYVQFQAEEGEQIVVPAKLNEDYAYTFKLFQPDTTLYNDSSYTLKTLPMLPDIDYVCPATGGSSSYTTGKLQYVADEGQTEIGNNNLLGVKQLAVFVEGAMLQEGIGDEDYQFDVVEQKIVFNTPLVAGQKITILYFK